MIALSKIRRQSQIILRKFSEIFMGEFSPKTYHGTCLATAYKGNEGEISCDF